LTFIAFSREPNTLQCRSYEFFGLLGIHRENSCFKYLFPALSLFLSLFLFVCLPSIDPWNIRYEHCHDGEENGARLKSGNKGGGSKKGRKKRKQKGKEKERKIPRNTDNAAILARRARNLVIRPARRTHG